MKQHRSSGNFPLEKPPPPPPQNTFTHILQSSLQTKEEKKG
jgi:hypothetical protein